MKPLILASASPIRKLILQERDIPFTVEVSGYDEDMSLAMEPPELAMYLSQGKAGAVAERHRREPVIILGADSFAIFGEQLLGKPHTTARAREMLTMLSGQRHDYVTGFTVIDAESGRQHTEAVLSTVYFKPLSSAEIDDYLAHNSVLDKAAAYDIGDNGRKLVQRIEGDRNNVRGLPIDRVWAALTAFGMTQP